MEFYQKYNLLVYKIYVYIYTYNSTAWPCLDSSCSKEPTTYF